MPYIKKENRENFDKLIQKIDSEVTCEGDLNYIFTSLLHKHIDANGLCYQTINNAIGVLECCKLELYAQIALPYENKKKVENGSVSELDKH